MTGYNVNLVGKRRYFPLARIICDAAAVDRNTHPPQTSILYEAGSCIPLAIYRLVGDVDIYNTYCEVAMGKPLVGSHVRPYRDCIDYTRCSELVPVEIDFLRLGGNYTIHADGRSAAPQCLRMQIDQGARSTVTTSSVMYFRHMSALKDILLIAVDKPLVFEYGDPHRQNSAGPGIRRWEIR